MYRPILDTFLRNNTHLVKILLHILTISRKISSLSLPQYQVEVSQSLVRRSYPNFTSAFITPLWSIEEKPRAKKHQIYFCFSGFYLSLGRLKKIAFFFFFFFFCLLRPHPNEIE